VCGEVTGAACRTCAVDCVDPATIGCCNLTDPGDVALCQALYTCIATKGCSKSGGDPIDCWCGTNGATCATDPAAANGPCLEEVVAAAKSDDPTIIKARFVDPKFPIGLATNEASCLGSFCPSECGFPP
jgi:hypothetical protein